ncbi:hypothetical protein GCM10010260_01450 [Streptomyces filipinensis]|uniref:Secreted protein n=1 Tax=Streptomyces filipinensis TaxID=66887 RepID=A0A918M7M4_9ACTN|nr:hypothetical protein [Streptomyces filipinensis]GGU73439.1 hypothetical protein GCM10010260_01450 [Streptomyces filipinensis]
MRSTRMRTAVGLLGAAAFCLAVPAQPSADTGAPPKSSPYCGTDRATGLGVSARGNVSCATALQVAAAYTEVWRGTAGAPVQVRAAGAVWKCRERQGDPDPYQQCADTRDDTRLVTLTS